MKHEMAALVDSMGDLKIEKILMDGATKFDRGLDEIAAFLTHARRVIDATKIKRLAGSVRPGR